MTRAERPADFVSVPDQDARIERQWAAIEQAGLPGLPAARSRVRAGLMLAAACALSSALVWLLVDRQPARLPVGALVLSAEAPIGVRLEDGSRLSLSPRSQMQLIKNERANVELDLRSGRVHFDVTHDRTRSFEVHAGLADVRVVGTRFDVERSARAGGSLVSISVLEGVVEVRRHDRAAQGAELRTLRAGESWSALLPDQPTTATAAAQAAPNADTAAPEAEESAEAADETEPSGNATPRAEHEAEHEASAREPAHEPTPERGAAHVFRRANLARRAGRMREAADGYAELLAHYPNDGRAGVAAFELGRIRMDALGDAVGAIDALEHALESSSVSSFHEDAMARIVVANDALGRMQACRHARDRYQARYPDGVHLHVLAARCQ